MARKLQPVTTAAVQPQQPTCTPEQISTLMQMLKAPEAMAAIMQAVRDTAAKEKQTNMEALTVKAFQRAGFGEVKPRIDARTYNLWIADGFKVKTGEKSVRVRNLRLFHRSQVEAISEKEKAAFLAEREARRTADNLPKPSPVAAEAPKTAKKAERVPISEANQVH